MTDYIKREEAQKEIVEWASRLANPEYLDRDATLDIIRLIPSADVAEIRHGKWVSRESVDKDYISYCSECGFPVSTFWNQSNYCPNCGARMEEVRKK